MKTIDFTQPGGFPLKQLTTKTMQDTYNSEILQAFIQWVSQGVDGANVFLPDLDIPVADAYILTGVEIDGSNVTPGWIIRNGELLQFVGSAVEDVNQGGGIGTQTTTTNATFKDGSIKPVYQEKIAVAGGNSPLGLNEYVRLPNVSQFAPTIRRNVGQILPSITAGSFADVEISVSGAAVGDAVVVASTVQNDFRRLDAYVSEPGLVRVRIYNNSAALFGGGNYPFKIRVIK